MSAQTTTESTQSISAAAIGLLAVLLIASIGHVFLLQGAEPYILGLPWWAIAGAVTYYLITAGVVLFIRMLGGE